MVSIFFSMFLTIFQVQQLPLSCKQRSLTTDITPTFIITQYNLNCNRNLTQPDIQTLSFFENKKIVETVPTTTQQNFSPIQSTLTTPGDKNNPFPQTALKSTVKPSVVPKALKWIIKQIDQKLNHDNLTNKIT